MKILVYGYYDDFANFFLNLRDYHKKINLNSEYYFLTPNISGYVTWDDNRKYFLKSKLRVSQHNTSKNVINDVVSIDALNILRAREISVNKILGKILSVRRVIEDVLPDIIIISGDSRPNSRVIKTLAAELGIRVLYFEQGPLKTTLISDCGVTANHNPYSNESYPSKVLSNNTIKDYNPSRWQRYLDIFQVFSKDEESNFDISLMLKKFKKSKFPQLTKPKSPRVRMLVVLQVPDDINSIFHGNFFNILQLIKYIDKVTPKWIEVVFREHPMYRGSYDSGIYDYILRNERFILDSALPGIPVDWSDYFSMVTVNSLMTFEAINNNVPVALLGQSSYANLVSYCHDFEALSHFISRSSEGHILAPSKNEIDEYMGASYLPGHYRSITNELLSKIVSKIEGKK